MVALDGSICILKIDSRKCIKHKQPLFWMEHVHRYFSFFSIFSLLSPIYLAHVWALMGRPHQANPLTPGFEAERNTDFPWQLTVQQPLLLYEHAREELSTEISIHMGIHTLSAILTLRDHPSASPPGT